MKITVVFNIVATLLYLIIAVICLVMAYKSFSARKYLPFHEQAAGQPWDRVDNDLQQVILTLLRQSGLGFLVIGLLIALFPALSFLRPDPVTKYLIPAIAFVYCVGLLVFNYKLYKNTKANTPWKGAVAALIVIALAIIFSSI